MSDISAGSSNVELVVESNESSAEWDERKRRNSGCSSDRGRQKKAKALTDSDTDADAEMTLLGVQNGYKRDATYYFEDGSCILLVEDTLFNVHKTILSRDTSTFGPMFSLPQGGKDVEGQSDGNPIVLTGDTVAEFQHFLWALYALPSELRVVTSPNANLIQLIDIARIGNKYSFKSVETWALDAIHDYVNRKPSPILAGMSSSIIYTFTPTGTVSTESKFKDRAPKAESLEQLTKLVRLAHLCNHEPLLNTMIGILRQLMSSSLQYAYLAMTLADELGLRALKGPAYLEVMQKGVVVRRTEVDARLNPPSQSQGENNGNGNSMGDQEGELDEDGRLIITRSQQLRLLAGYYRLTGTWERLRTAPPHFDHAISCGATWHQHGCTQSWLEFWKEKTRTDAVLSLGLADVLGRLKQVQKDYDRWGSATYMHHDCRMAARRSILEVIKNVEDALPDFFSESGTDE